MSEIKIIKAFRGNIFAILEYRKPSKDIKCTFRKRDF